MKSVKMTLASVREPNDLDTQLVRTMVAKSIGISEERVILDGSSEGPIESIQLQIAEVLNPVLQMLLNWLQSMVSSTGMIVRLVPVLGPVKPVPNR
ncbi:ACT domain-containing protein [Artemisia annua]|uniref:ACT domain-containing protein n=1 Tax=Artemisia annua TaxID=35608 RepID=A0A2U1NAN3_ARTAN|nr:ACT domain-containing protein [Artemisia annua]